MLMVLAALLLSIGIASAELNYILRTAIRAN